LCAFALFLLFLACFAIALLLLSLWLLACFSPFCGVLDGWILVRGKRSILLLLLPLMAVIQCDWLTTKYIAKAPFRKSQQARKRKPNTASPEQTEDNFCFVDHHII
jgi:hypothetical protein